MATHSHFDVASPEVRKRFDRLRRHIASELRKADDLPELEEILTITSSLNYETELERSKALEQLTDKLFGKSMPRYDKTVQEITERDLDLLANDPDEYQRRKSKLEAS